MQIQMKTCLLQKRSVSRPEALMLRIVFHYFIPPLRTSDYEDWICGVWTCSNEVQEKYLLTLREVPFAHILCRRSAT
jgi:hypothetical protein